MIPVRNPRLRGAILATAFASSMAVGPMAHAGDSGETFNDASVRITGGKGVAVATCVNWAKDWAGYDDDKKKKHEQRRAKQANRCDQTAKATGGDVTLEYVDVFIDQEGGKKKRSKNNATVEIEGGDAVAVAACINVLNNAADATQINKCKNNAVAKGGDVNLKKVDITVIQTSE
jgi:hypothetical protein